MEKTEMIMQSDYMNGNATHEEYYGEIARECGKLTLPASPETLKAKLADDRHLNNIPLAAWNRLAKAQRNSIAPHVCKRSSGGCSLSDLVCVLKAAARIEAGEMID